MTNVIKFPVKNVALDEEARALLGFAHELDGLIVNTLNSGALPARDVVGVLAHRLGALLKHMEEKPELLDVCVKVAKKQASID